MIGLHNLKSPSGAKKNRRRVGRGNASGKGNYSGRGIKGQKARASGKSGLTLKGIKGYLQKIPKVRGFSSLKVKKAVINLGELEKSFTANQLVTPRLMAKKGLIKDFRFGVKVLASGKISKPLIIQANAFSSGAKSAIVKAGGQAQLIKRLKA